MYKAGRVKEVSPCEMTSPLETGRNDPIRATFPSPWVVSSSQHTEHQVRIPEDPSKTGSSPPELFPFWLLGIFRKGDRGRKGEHKPLPTQDCWNSSGPQPSLPISTAPSHKCLFLAQRTMEEQSSPAHSETREQGGGQVYLHCVHGFSRDWGKAQAGRGLQQQVTLSDCDAI